MNRRQLMQGAAVLPAVQVLPALTGTSEAATLEARAALVVRLEEAIYAARHLETFNEAIALWQGDDEAVERDQQRKAAVSEARAALAAFDEAAV